MVEELRAYNHSLLAGCGLVTLVIATTMVSILVLLFARDRQGAQYPGSFPVSSHSNYKGLPFEYRWDDSYRTTDNFTDVYNWYSIRFDMGAEARANGDCILLEASNAQLAFSRQISVFLCKTRIGQMIYVTRSTSFAGRSEVVTGLDDLRQSLFAARPRPASR